MSSTGELKGQGCEDVTAQPPTPSTSRREHPRVCLIATRAHQEGIERAVEIMRSGSMFRFDNPDGVEDEVSKAEVDIAEYTQFKYAVGMNSCGSCIFTALEAIGVQRGDKVHPRHPPNTRKMVRDGGSGRKEAHSGARGCRCCLTRSRSPRFRRRLFIVGRSLCTWTARTTTSWTWCVLLTR
jgi:hypothetical protein